MIGFHIDMNMGQFRGDYLEKWLRDLARIGYDTILWEVENTIQWDTCPECVSVDAFQKAEFRRILKLCRKLGLDSIPLLQSLGHSEYVLRHEKYRELRERPEGMGQYCARSPKVLAFLTKWIDEYLDLFGKVRYFHLGADEAHGLGRCQRCSDYIKKHSVSQLYISHINAVSRAVLDRGVTPMIWSDMLMTHPEALEKLSRKVMLLDWRYDTYRGMKSVRVWGLKPDTYPADRIPADVLAKYGRFMYPLTDEPCRQPEPFYTADFLAANGFQVVGGPASSCFGDSVFAPTHWRHLVNTLHWTQKGLQPHLRGAIVTSWTVRLVPWELQLSAIEAPGFARMNPDGSAEAYQKHFAKRHFGVDDPAFWRATGLLSKLCLFMESRSLGFYKGCRPTPPGHIEGVLAGLVREKRLEAELATARAALAGYVEARKLLQSFARKAKKGHDFLAMWDWSARNQINRGRASVLLLESRLKARPAAERRRSRAEAKRVLAEMRKLTAETERMYLTMQKPTRAREIVAWMYEAVGRELEKVAGAG